MKNYATINISASGVDQSLLKKKYEVKLMSRPFSVRKKGRSFMIDNLTPYLAKELVATAFEIEDSFKGMAIIRELSIQASRNISIRVRSTEPRPKGP